MVLETILKCTCLKPSYLLRKQLLLSFGSLSFLTVVLVVTIACIFLNNTSHVVVNQSNILFQKQIIDRLVLNSLCISHTIAAYMENIEGSVQIIAEVVKDRFVGYSHGDDDNNNNDDSLSWLNDSFVPFFDMFNTTKRKYPLQSKPLLLDWEMLYYNNKDTTYNNNNVNRNLDETETTESTTTSSSSNSNYFNSHRHDQHKEGYLPEFPYLSTETGTYYMRGSCDSKNTRTTTTFGNNVTTTPSMMIEYYYNCTDEVHNNVRTGGIVQPTKTNYGLYSKSADIVTLMKPIYESHLNIFTMNIIYINDGAGSIASFPGGVLNFFTVQPYVSQGCDWMRQLNPMTQKPYGTERMIRRCHPNGTYVQDSRDMNPLELGFVQKILLADPATNNGIRNGSNGSGGGGSSSNGVNWDGPIPTFDNFFPVILAGRSVYDRKTGELIGAIIFGSTLEDIHTILHDSILNHDEIISLVNYETGQVFADSTGSKDPNNNILFSTTNGTGLLSKNDFDYLKKCVQNISTTMSFVANQYNSTTTSSSTQFNEARRELPPACFIRSNTTDRVYVAFHLFGPQQPGSPSSSSSDDDDDNSTSSSRKEQYEVQFLMIHTFPSDILQVRDEVIDNINHYVLESCLLLVFVGTVGFVFVLCFVWIIAKFLTRPLVWIDTISWQIVNHTHVLASTKETFEKNNSSNYQPMMSSSKNFMVYRPTTEIDTLVSEFQKLIHGFSGKDNASTIALGDVREIKNELTWQTYYQTLYTPLKVIVNNDTTTNTPPTTKENKNNNNMHHVKQQLSNSLKLGREESDGMKSTMETSGDDFMLDNNNNNPANAVPNNQQEDNGASSTSLSSLSEAVPAAITTTTTTTTTDVPVSQAQPPTTQRLSLVVSAPTTTSPAANPADPKTTLTPSSEPQVLKSVVIAPPKCHLNKNIVTNNNNNNKEYDNRDINNTLYTMKSSLFWWLVLLIVMPLVITNAALCAIVSVKISNTIPSVTNEVQNESKLLESTTLNSVAKLKAKQAETILQKFLRDSHLLTRIGGWLLFNGINRTSGGGVYLETKAETCKNYPDSTCPQIALINKQCSCDWNDFDIIETGCTNLTELIGRDYQMGRYLAEARDYDPITGNREYVSPKPFDQQNDTVWWDNDVTKMPGYVNHSIDPIGYNTTYDRYGVVSAISVVLAALYNYETRLNRNNKQIVASAISFDADGMHVSYEGCTPLTISASQFVSNSMNRAAEIAPQLCPLGKYGYDPRCRNWYDTGKQLYFHENRPAYVTAPYPFATWKIAGATITTPIVDPSTSSSSYVGQTLLDFTPSAIQDIFGPIHDVIPIVITTETDRTVEDTVIGPFDDENWKTANILDLIFPNDPNNTTLRETFATTILNKLKAGEANDESLTFYRTKAPRTTTSTAAASKDGTDENTNNNDDDVLVEELQVIYQPINGRVLMANQPHDFVYGVNVSSMLIYSLGIIYNLEYISLPWKKMNNDTDMANTIEQSKLFFIVICIIISLLFIFIACCNTVSITRPIITLLNIVEVVNMGKIDRGIPPMNGCGSKEVLQVYHSFSKLFNIVRGSNVAFFSGNLLLTYDYIMSALTLFRKVGDEKAIGITCCNLGNTIHAMLKNHYDSSITTIPTSHTNTITTTNNNSNNNNNNNNHKNHDGLWIVVEEEDYYTLAMKALDHYEEAIQISQQHIERCCSGDIDDIDNNETMKMNLLQQLSDRLFNRVLLFRLLLKHGIYIPDNAHERSIADLRTVQDYDQQVKQYWYNHSTILYDQSEWYFYRLLQRSWGILEYYNELNSIWNVEELVQEADQFLLALWDTPYAPLFDKMNCVGRLQSLECVAIQLELCKQEAREQQQHQQQTTTTIITTNNTNEAGRMAMRMFVEDEYILEGAFKVASTALLKLFRNPNHTSGLMSSTSSPAGAGTGTAVVEASSTSSLSRTRHFLETDLRKMQKTCSPSISLDIQKCVVFAFEINEMWEGTTLLQCINEYCLKVYDQYCSIDDCIGVVAYTTKGDLNVPAKRKGDDTEGRQRVAIDVATTSTSERVCSALPYAIQVMIDSSALYMSSTVDSFIIYILDGYSWDSSIVQTYYDRLLQYNMERSSTKLHMIIIGIDIEEQEIIDECKLLCTISSSSKYMDLKSTTHLSSTKNTSRGDRGDGTTSSSSNNNNNIHPIFESVRTILFGGGGSSSGSGSGTSSSSSYYNSYNQCLLMEKF